MKTLLQDTFGRTVRKLRISVTDHCNLRCTYCMPEEGLKWLKPSEILTYEEIHTLANLFVSLGIEHVRLTGGEPLMRKNLPFLVEQLNTLKPLGLKTIGLTTNGVLLEDHLEPLKNAGLDHINISLDTIDPKRFEAISKRDNLEQVKRGIMKAKELYPPHLCKINAVVHKGINESRDDIKNLVHFAADQQMELRFIEKMPLEAQQNWKKEDVVSGGDILDIFPKGTFVKKTSRGSSPAEQFQFKDRPQTIGLINSVTEPFCSHCDRVRLTADGGLRNCLFATWETNLKEPLREGASSEELEALIRENISKKWAGHQINRSDFKPASRSMSQIGG